MFLVLGDVEIFEMPILLILPLFARPLFKVGSIQHLYNKYFLIKSEWMTLAYISEILKLALIETCKGDINLPYLRKIFTVGLRETSCVGRAQAESAFFFLNG